ncbi:MAG: diguanylate cyclase [Hungatella sp.]|nr:diguanylate cyclase [Hungatella sp.]
MSNEQELKQKILIVDDSEMNRAILTDMLESEYEIIEAENGREAISLIEKHGTELSVILLDIVMPELDGFGVLDVMNRRRWIEDIPVIMISSESGSSHMKRAYELGSTDYISRPFDVTVVHRRVVNTIMLYAKQKKLAALVMEQIDENEKQSTLMIDILSHIVEFRNGESGLHVLHIRVLTELILKHLVEITDRYPFKLEEISMISTASALHDIGKISIPGEILNKPGRLTKEEFDTMKTHTTIGAEMLENLAFHQEEPLVKEAYAICRWHHERYDGRGYPDGLKGDEIPISAQVVALADVYDALTSERVYKKAFPHEEAVRMICNGECGTFNPLLLKCLNDIADTLQEKLNNTAPGRTNEQELQEILEDKLHPKENSASERTLQLLERERMKCSFYASMSNEIQFEYNMLPPMVTLSAWGAEKLQLPESIMDPFSDGSPIFSIVDRSDIEELSRILKGTTPQEPVVRYDCKVHINGEFRWARIVCQVLWSSDEDPQFSGVIGKAVDIHDSRMRMDALEKMASHDTLTKLLNYDYAKGRIEERLRMGNGKRYALMLIDVDGIKKANEKGGREFGNQVLTYVAEKLRELLGEGEIAARISGDEFLFLAKCDSTMEEAAQRIAMAVEGNYRDFQVSVCIGMAGTSHMGIDYDVLFHGADAALRAAKKKGPGQRMSYIELISVKQEEKL